MPARPHTFIRHRPHRPVALAVLATVGVLIGLSACTPHVDGASPLNPTHAAQAATTAPDASPGNSGGGNGSGGASDDACALVTVDEVSTAVGTSVTQSNPGPAPFCAYANTDVTKQVIVKIYTDRASLELTVVPLEAQSEHLDGLGDDAFWNGAVGLIFVRVGDRSFTIAASVNPLDPAGAKAAMVTLATAALSRF